MTIYFDMDGTIADLYAVGGWLDMLIAESPTPYAVAQPLMDMDRLARLLNELQAKGYKIGIVSWLSKSGSADYGDDVRNAKNKWLTENLPSVYWDEIHIVKYGTPKQNIVKDKNGILFDDEDNNRNNWKGKAYLPTECFEILSSLI